MSESPRYEVIDVIASGGMATVWRARDTRLGRVVALKRPHPAPEGSQIALRFARESRLAATVAHPNLVTVFDAGSDDTGPYLVMELVNAATLAEAGVDASRLSVIAAETSSALAALHAAGIVHRDVKPSNILLADSGVKLTDFGIARSPADSGSITRSGSVMATPGYAAPEVLAGSDPTPASDVYSLGALLYEQSTGHRFTAGDGAGPGDLDAGPLTSVITAMLSPDPLDRPAAANLSTEMAALSGSTQTIEGTDSTQAIRLGDAGLGDDDGLTGSGPPTREMPAVGPDHTDATRQLDVPPHQPASPPSVEPEDRPRRAVWALVGLGIVSLLLLANAILGGEDDPTAVAAVLATTTTSAASTATTIPATTLIEVPDISQPIAGPAEETTVEDAQQSFVDFVLDVPRRVLKKKEADKIVDQVNDAVDAYVDDEADKARTKIEDAASTISDEIDSESTVDRAIELLAALASRLGFTPADFGDDSGSG